MMELFTPIKIRNTFISNRIVMAATQKVGFTYDGGCMGDDVICEYEGLASNDIGLMISQSMMITPEDLKAAAYPVPAIFREEQAEPIRRIAEAARARGSCFLAQIGTTKPYSPEMSTAELENLREQFIRSIQLCIDAGTAGVELHGAHTLTLNRILSPLTNGRTDKYSDGMVFVREIVERVREIAPDDFILAIRMGSSYDWDIDIPAAKELEKIGFDVLDVSMGIHEIDHPELPDGYEYMPMTYAAEVVKKHVQIPVIAAWGIETLRRGDELIRTGRADMAAYGKPFLADPAFVIHGKENPDYAPCRKCARCQWYSDGYRCPARRDAQR